ncbi:hypothetical protein DFH27DRAFT_615937 [Peziza echinospora]|nr:hypothetical protein DFH27DRAFT_615937 [Peziza echinospora]
MSRPASPLPFEVTPIEEYSAATRAILTDLFYLLSGIQFPAAYEPYKTSIDNAGDKYVWSCMNAINTRRSSICAVLEGQVYSPTAENLNGLLEFLREGRRDEVFKGYNGLYAGLFIMMAIDYRNNKRFLEGDGQYRLPTALTTAHSQALTAVKRVLVSMGMENSTKADYMIWEENVREMRKTVKRGWKVIEMFMAANAPHGLNKMKYTQAPTEIDYELEIENIKPRIFARRSDVEFWCARVQVAGSPELPFSPLCEGSMRTPIVIEDTPPSTPPFFNMYASPIAMQSNEGDIDDELLADAVEDMMDALDVFTKKQFKANNARADFEAKQKEVKLLLKRKRRVISDRKGKGKEIKKRECRSAPW